MLKTSLFISYDGVWCFCSVVLFYQMVKRNLSLRHFCLFRSAIPLTQSSNCWSRSIIPRSWSRSSRLSSRSKLPKSQKTNAEFQGVPKRNSSILTIRMKENITVQLIIMVKQDNITKTLLTYFNSLKIVSRELRYEKDKNITLIRK
jgi:hypothetical protein